MNAAHFFGDFDRSLAKRRQEVRMATLQVVPRDFQFSANLLCSPGTVMIAGLSRARQQKARDVGVESRKFALIDGFR